MAHSKELWGRALVAVGVLLAALVFSLSTKGGIDRDAWRDGDGDVLPDGRDSGDFSIAMGNGPEHCSWESATFLNVAWPPGTLASSQDDVRQFVHDPTGLFATGGYLRGAFEQDAEPPADAATTGLHSDEIELWAAPSDPDAVYVRHDDGTYDRWPRADPPILCE